MDQKKEIAQKLFNSFDQFSKLKWNQSPVSKLKRSEIFTLLSIKNLMESKDSPVKVTDISKLLDVAPPTTTSIITGLEHKGYVERSTNNADRRVVQIVLTEKGSEAIKIASEAFHQYFEGLAAHLGEEKSNDLADLLTMVFNYFKSMEGKVNTGEFKL